MNYARFRLWLALTMAAPCAWALQSQSPQTLYFYGPVFGSGLWGEANWSENPIPEPPLIHWVDGSIAVFRPTILPFDVVTVNLGGVAVDTVRVENVLPLLGPVTVSVLGSENIALVGAATFDVGNLSTMSWSVPLTGSAGLIKQGPGTLTLLHPVSTFTGALAVRDGRVELASLANAGVSSAAGAGNTVILGDAAGGTSGRLDYLGGSATTNRSWILSGPVSQLTVADSNTVLTLSGLVSGDGAVWEKWGAGALRLTGANTFEALPWIQEGAVVVGDDLGLSSGPGPVTVGASSLPYVDAALLLENGVAFGRDVLVAEGNEAGQSRLGLSGSGAASFAGGLHLERRVELSAPADGWLAFTGAITGSNHGLVKTGAGTVWLQQPEAVTFERDVSVTAGALLLSGNYTADYFSVNPGATFGGTGSVRGDIIVASGGSLAPGGSQAATWEVSGLTMGAGSVFHWQLGEQGLADQIVFSPDALGDLFIDTGTLLNVDLSLLEMARQPWSSFPEENDLFWQSDQVWKIIAFNGTGVNYLTAGMLDPFNVLNGSEFAGGTFMTFVGGGNLGFDSQDVYLRFTPVAAVPEPSTWILLLTGGGVLAIWLRRSRSRSRS